MKIRTDTVFKDSLENLNDQKHEKIFICEDCGREYQRNIPFPQGCICGNWHEDTFREKDIYDFEDESQGKPLCGVKYDPEVLKYRDDKLKIVRQKSFTLRNELHVIKTKNAELINKKKNRELKIFKKAETEKQEKAIFEAQRRVIKIKRNNLFKEKNHAH